MTKYATFSNFVGFGQYVNIELKFEIRQMISARVTKRLIVSTKIAGYEFGHGNTSYANVVVERATKLINDLYVMVQALDDRDVTESLKASVLKHLDLILEKLHGHAFFSVGSAEERMTIFLMLIQGVNEKCFFDASK